jgi:hypothetical protein
MNTFKQTAFCSLILFLAIFASAGSAEKKSNQANDDLSDFSQKLSDLTIAASAKNDDQSVVLYVNTFYKAYDNSNNKAALTKYKAWFDNLRATNTQSKAIYTIGLKGMSESLKIGSFTNYLQQRVGGGN